MFPKIALSIAIVMLSFFSKAQDSLHASFDKASAEMRVRNLYQTIVWHMCALNDYQFDQKAGKVTYTIIDTEAEVKAVPKVLGTFNLDDNTFLWADKNPSIRPALSDQVNAFRAQLPKHTSRINLSRPPILVKTCWLCSVFKSMPTGLTYNARAIPSFILL